MQILYLDCNGQESNLYIPVLQYRGVVFSQVSRYASVSWSVDVASRFHLVGKRIAENQ